MFTTASLVLIMNATMTLANLTILSVNTMQVMREMKRVK
jgi:hypothetical protein